MSKITKINYELMVQECLRNVIKQILTLVEKNGLPGAHHFYISFKTDYPGVDLPDFLKEEYPDEVTIVLQHEFWDLEVEEDNFYVTLCFNDIHERLTIPFHSIVAFVDHSVNFGLQFTPPDQPIPFPFEEKKNPFENSSDSLEKKPATNNVISLDAFRKK